jgi:hypothetical protein
VLRLRLTRSLTVGRRARPSLHLEGTGE